MINLHRMLHFAKWTLAVDKPYYRMSMTIYLAATAICLQLLNIDYLLDKNGNPFMAIGIYVAMPIATVVFAGSYMFQSFQKYKEGIREMFLIPASNIEKFLVRYILPTIILLAMTIVSLLIADVLQYLVGMIIHREPLFFVFIELWKGVTGPFDLPDGTILFVTLLLFWIHTIYLLGANIFRNVKYNWAFTSLFLLLLFIVMGKIIPVLAHHPGRILISSCNQHPVPYIIGFPTVGVLNFWLSYKLFCRRQIIGRFINI